MAQYFAWQTLSLLVSIIWRESPGNPIPDPLWTSTYHRHKLHIIEHSLETASTMTFRV